MKIKEFKNGAYVTFERDAGGLWAVLLRDPAGNVADKVRCDTYRDALAYQRSFCAIASRGYIQSWLSGAEISDKSAQRIFSVADKILKAGA